MNRHTRPAILCAALTLCLAASWASPPGHAGDTHPASDPNIIYIGRTDDTRPDSRLFTYPGVQIRCGFTGTSLRMWAKRQSGYFMVEVDGGEARKVAVLEDTVVTLTDRLQAGEHQVVITYATEGYDRRPEFKGLVTDPGAGLIPARGVPSRKIEFVGNSITCGYGNEAGGANTPYLELTSNYYHTYAALTARRLGAQAVVVARSGIGVYRSYNAPPTGDRVNMNTEYPHTLLYDDRQDWDFSRYTPDVVCVNLGTNDTSTKGADTTLLHRGFTRLYRQIRSHYPEASIVLLTGCMMSGDALATAIRTLDRVAEEARLAGDSRVYRLDFEPHDGSLGYGTHWHPSMRQHQKMADALTGYLRQIMGWADN